MTAKHDYLAAHHAIRHGCGAPHMPRYDVACLVIFASGTPLANLASRYLGKSIQALTAPGCTATDTALWLIPIRIGIYRKIARRRAARSLS